MRSVIVFKDRDGDELRYTPRDTGEGRSTPDPIITIVRSPGTPAENSQSVVFREDEAEVFLTDLARGVLGDGYEVIIRRRYEP